MQTGKSKIALVVLCGVALAFEVWHLRTHAHSDQQQIVPAPPKLKPNFVLLPATEIAAYAALFTDPKPRMENWEPTVADMDDVEANLSQVIALSSKDPDANRHIDDPKQYFRQYLAVVMDGKKSIFVNAMCRVDPSQNWRKRLLLGNDGGKCYWHTTYDVSTRRFSNLMVSGSG